VKRAETFRFGFRQFLPHDGIDAASARASPQGFVQLVEVRRVARGDDFDMAVFGIAHPAAKVKPGSFAMDKPPKSDALDAAFD